MKSYKEIKSRRHRERVQPTNDEQKPSMCACTQALGLPELLEEILQYLDQRTLLVSAQRVCRSWNRVIGSSVLLQQLLFFKPMSATVATDASVSTLKNPLLAEAFYLFYEHCGRISMGAFVKSRLSIANMKAGRRCHLAFVRPEASWRRMLVAHPAPRRIGYLRGCGNRFSWQHIEMPDQLRMGQLYDMVYAAVWGDATPARGDHRVWLNWKPQLDDNRPQPAWSGILTQWAPSWQPWGGHFPAFPASWVGSVDLVIYEAVAVPQQDPRGSEYPLPRKKCLGSQWVFKSHGFEAPALNLVPL
ncbi:hypothetical protein GQ53DRAFT_750825 [Thozetella sp. PMI_491]|nr:hypothetical protein GQ53DRAFT_750825 [Thozetella sp. PMI_491]